MADSCEKSNEFPGSIKCVEYSCEVLLHVEEGMGYVESDTLHNDFVEHDAVAFDNCTIIKKLLRSKIRVCSGQTDAKGSDVPKTIYNIM